MKPIKKTSIIDEVVSNLKELITSGKLRIGDKFPTEKELCTDLKVGRSTVREALRMLKALGFVELIQGRGAFVAKVKEDDPRSIVIWFVENEVQITDFMEVRASIETLAVKLAIPRITNKEIQKLEQIQKDFEKAVFENDVIKLITYDEAFHKMIVDATGNKLLIGIYDKVAEGFTDYRAKSFSIRENAKNALGPHQNILNAIKNKNVEEAVVEVINHINISIADISKMTNIANKG
ncbi:MAG: GntR domain protein [Bacilli bacterium]|nr:GntR domain protein [Bacilli bacterium]